MLKATIVTRKGTSKKSIGKNKQSENNKVKSSNAQRCVASTSDDGEIIYREATTGLEGRKRLSDV